MKAYETEERGGHDVLTEKQCEVLDLLIEHKTSKEIARELGISPHTVDQRISLARGRLGASSRNELAARYRSMRETFGQSPPDELSRFEEEQPQPVYDAAVYGLASAGPGESVADREGVRQDDGDLLSPPLIVPDRKSCPTASDLEYRVGPEVFEGRSGGLWRIGAIVGTALLLAVTVLVLFAIVDQLNNFLGLIFFNLG